MILFFEQYLRCQNIYNYFHYNVGSLVAEFLEVSVYLVCWPHNLVLMGNIIMVPITNIHCLYEYDNLPILMLNMLLNLGLVKFLAQTACHLGISARRTFIVKYFFHSQFIALSTYIYVCIFNRMRMITIKQHDMYKLFKTLNFNRYLLITWSDIFLWYRLNASKVVANILNERLNYRRPLKENAYSPRTDICASLKLYFISAYHTHLYSLSILCVESLSTLIWLTDFFDISQGRGH